ncbi:MAG TPA: SH3 domain-containing protein [Pyrinomonadaceae bacterium]|nr:SH3 domain-containing protein [Pyrinomonadaceae bacterium]
MLIRPSRIALLCLFMFFPALALAQEDESITLRSGIVQRTTRVRRKPAANQRVISVLQPSARVRIINSQARGGFVRVLLEKGRQGYVSASDIRVDTSLSSTAAAASSSAPCEDSLEDCENIGCAQPGSPQAIFNQAKRHVPTGTASRLLNFADFRRLQNQADEVVDQGSGLSQEERDSLRGFTVSSGTVGEGSLVKIVGFLARGLDPHPNTGESVNCRFTEAENNDFHISLAPRATNTEFQGIVVEMIPQDRPEGWTIPKLRRVKQQRRRVMAIGGLFYDNLHVVNSDASDPIPRQPRRFSLWEVHPITRFFVCERTNNACSPGNLSQWTPLEDFQ